MSKQIAIVETAHTDDTDTTSVTVLDNAGEVNSSSDAFGNPIALESVTVTATNTTDTNTAANVTASESNNEIAADHLLNAADFLNGAEVRKKVVIPELKGFIYIAEPSAEDVFSVTAMLEKNKEGLERDKLIAALLVKCAVDGQGNRIFEGKDYRSLLSYIKISVFARLSAVMLQMINIEIELDKSGEGSGEIPTIA